MVNLAGLVFYTKAPANIAVPTAKSEVQLMANRLYVRESVAEIMALLEPKE